MLFGLTIIVMGMYGRQRRLEMQHKERLAMIEKGLVPPPDGTAEANELARTYVGAVLGARDRAIPLDSRGRVMLFLPKREKYRTAGITMIGFGGALMLILMFAANEPGVALGVGGAFMALGASGLATSPPNKLLRMNAAPAQPPPASHQGDSQPQG